MKRAYDLTAAATFLASNPNAQDFIEAVRKFQSVISVSTDLMQSKESVDALREMRLDISSNPHIARALLMHAVVVYCRASHTKAVERYNVGVIGAYSAELRKKHQEIVTLRNKVLAHFGPGEGWHEERVIYLEQVHGDGITAVHQRVNSDSMVFDNLYELLEVAIPHVKKKEVSRATELDAALDKSPELFKEIHLLPFDVEAFYKSTPDGAKNFWGPTGFMAEHVVRSEVVPSMQMPPAGRK